MTAVDEFAVVAFAVVAFAAAAIAAVAFAVRHLEPEERKPQTQPATYCLWQCETARELYDLAAEENELVLVAARVAQPVDNAPLHTSP